MPLASARVTKVYLIHGVWRSYLSTSFIWLSLKCFRHGKSLQSLRDLKSLNTKIVLLSAMTNLTAMRMMATYVEMNDNYFTVGRSILLCCTQCGIPHWELPTCWLDIWHRWKHQKSPFTATFREHCNSCHHYFQRECNVTYKCSETSWHCCRVAYIRLQRFWQASYHSKWDSGSISILAST